MFCLVFPIETSTNAANRITKKVSPPHEGFWRGLRRENAANSSQLEHWHSGKAKKSCEEVSGCQKFSLDWRWVYIKSSKREPKSIKIKNKCLEKKKIEDHWETPLAPLDAFPNGDRPREDLRWMRVRACNESGKRWLIPLPHCQPACWMLVLGGPMRILVGWILLSCVEVDKTAKLVEGENFSHTSSKISALN